MASSVLCAVPVGMVLALLAIPTVSAQEHCKMSWEPPADTKYTQQHVIDVGDVPGHQVRIFEIHTVYSNDKPNCEGLKRTESWARGYSDYIDRNGRNWGYFVTTLENGDNIYGEWTGTAQTVIAADGSKKSTSVNVTRWTGGTGKYLAVRALGRDRSVFDLDKGVNQTSSETEYWFQK